MLSRIPKREDSVGSILSYHLVDWKSSIGKKKYTSTMLQMVGTRDNSRVEFLYKRKTGVLFNSYQLTLYFILLLHASSFSRLRIRAGLC